MEEKKEKNEEPDGLAIPDSPEETPEGQRDSTDIIMGQITIIVMNKQDVKPGYFFTFSKKRPVLSLGSDEEQCGKHGIVFDHEDVASVHATIRCYGDEFVLQDEGAQAGIFYEGKKMIANTSAVLKPVSTIRLGALLLNYRLESPSFQMIVPEFAEAAAAIVGEESKAAVMEAASDGVVIAEFYLLSLDAPYALTSHCEIRSKSPVFLLGRSNRCHYRVEFKDQYVEDEQASISYSAQEEVFLVKGLVRENPIFVNEHRVKDVYRLKSGDVIRMGVAGNAPKIRFTLPGHEEEGMETAYFSKTLPEMVRGHIYYVGNSDQCHIRIEDTSVTTTVAEIKVPEKGDLLLVSKAVASRHKIIIDGSEVKENETRSLSLHQTLQIDSCFSLIYDHKNFVVPKVPENCVLSDFISAPQREAIYLIGSAMHCTVRIPDLEAPDLIGEIFVPLEGEYFLFKKYSGVAIDVTIGGELVLDGPVNQTRLGINQVLTIGDYLAIRNNHRSLPPPASVGMWKSVLKIGLLLLLALLVISGVAVGIKKYWPKIKNFRASNQIANDKKEDSPTNPQKLVQKLMKQYQKNVFYIILFNDKEKIASGTGFLLPQRDANEKMLFYLVTCKHVIEPWKFEKHKISGDKIVDEKGKPVGRNYYIGVWPFGAKVLQPSGDKWQYLFGNCFTNDPERESMGTLRVHRMAEDHYAEENGFRYHQPNSNSDIAILEMTPKDDKMAEKLAADYQNWQLFAEQNIDVGEPVIALGYPQGSDRLAGSKNGLVVPVSCEGKLASSCKAPDFLEININQTSGASGGPIINYKGEIVGMVSFSNRARMVGGIHSVVMQELIKR